MFLLTSLIIFLFPKETNCILLLLLFFFFQKIFLGGFNFNFSHLPKILPLLSNIVLSFKVALITDKTVRCSDSLLVRITEIRSTRDGVILVVEVKTVNGEYVSPAETFCLQIVVVS